MRSLLASALSEEPSALTSGRRPFSFGLMISRSPAYRLELDSIWHVAVLGQQPDHELDRRLRLVLSSGELVSLPEGVLQIPFARRATATELGPWVEGHHWPGKRLTDL